MPMDVVMDQIPRREKVGLRMLSSPGPQGPAPSVGPSSAGTAAQTDVSG